MSKIETEVSEINDNGYKYSIRHIKGKSMGSDRHGVSTWTYENGSILTESYHMGRLHGKTVDCGNSIYYIHGNEATKEEFRRYELIEKLADIGE